MNRNIEELCKDPLFQLNLAIWMLQPQPAHYVYVNPLFFKLGFRIYSIGVKLALTPDIRLAISEKIDCQDVTRPDLIMESKGENKFCILECKASSFGEKSTTAKQARTLLIISGPILPEILGIKEQIENIFCYLLGPNQIEMMDQTLKILKKEIGEKVKLETGEYGLFEIIPGKSSIILNYSQIIKKFFGLSEHPPVEILDIDEDTDPRPLYFIPFDPNVHQKDAEQEMSRRILYERILSYIISNIGGALIPSTITLTTEEILNFVTFGIYEVWDDEAATKYIRRLTRKFLLQMINSLNIPLIKYIKHEPPKGWIFSLNDKKSQEEMLKQLSKFKPEKLAFSDEKQGDLFPDFSD